MQISELSGATRPYMLTFIDNIGTGPFEGGQALIFGYEYSSSTHGFQQAMKYDGTFKKRSKRDGVWTSWTNV